MFYGITALQCAACDIIFKMNLPLIQEPTAIEWAHLSMVLNKRDNLCENCTGALKNV